MKFNLVAQLISGAPLLGSVQTLEATFSGYTFGLPVAEVLPFLFENCYMAPFSIEFSC